MSSPLPKHLRLLRDRVRTLINKLDALERMEFAAELGALASEQKRNVAYAVIEREMIACADVIGVAPSEKVMLTDIIARLRAENQRLTEANVMLMQGRAA